MAENKPKNDPLPYIRMKVDGKIYKTPLHYLEPKNTYVVHINGYRIFITVEYERPEFCSQIETFSRVLNNEWKN